MGRWLVILSLAIGQCPDIAAAIEPSSEVPLPKPRPKPAPPRQERQAPTVKAAAAIPHAAPRGEADDTATPAEPSAAQEFPAAGQNSSGQASSGQDSSGQDSSGQDSSGPDSPANESAAQMFRALFPFQPPAIETTPVQPEEGPPAKSARVPGDCAGGKRIVSAYYAQGRQTASGQPFDPHGMTAAHRTLPFGTRLTVSNPRTGKSVIVVINDRGPFVSGVSLDLALGAAQAIGMHGTGAVCIW
jgi:rare lipoprotein A